MAAWREWLIVGALLGLAGCTAIEYLPESSPEMLVVREGAEVWFYGPQQPGGADRRLALGDRVRVVRKEFGFSRVQLETGETGYVGNEDLEEAPPGDERREWPGVGGVGLVADDAAARVDFARRAEVERAAAVGRRPRSEPKVPTGMMVDDAPLPEPDFEALPEDGPVGGE